jgi:hypothetical protein
MSKKVDELYAAILHLQARLNEHGWSRSLTKYDASFLVSISQDLQKIANQSYTLTQEDVTKS